MVTSIGSNIRYGCIVPANTEVRSSTEGLVQAMSQVSLKKGEIKGLKEVIEKLKQEMKVKHDKMAQLHRNNQDLQERVSKPKTKKNTIIGSQTCDMGCYCYRGC